ncbi:NAD-binding protein [Marinomonas mediterranea]|jgi:3-hydroxyisobutyrate dehydrogenase and related beta-hydroxyacid dehydrogenases|uniref:2-hydroxy-3-oxopropionate reductase n=2 Tax=Marinomonas mediterranea TaxID=119864 RepID=F2JYI2_MARM1|nr:2-hydroxy-3-oxopropionate reductase [Marinomonas mediterranea MMB-1]WCN11019.1 NAD-binding protein [Marinomonas mediterranea]WCN19120.1 NAD-binding protein [Marinomonas mediterranea MMB-1]
MQKQRVAFIGLGVMGYPMAGHLAKAGYDVTVYNRTSSKAEQWAVDYDGKFGVTPSLAADGADVVFVCVGNDNDVRSVIYGDDGVLSSMKEGAVLVDHTTTSANLAQELFDASQKQGVGFIDAPVSGGQAGAENGKLTVMCGGEASVFNSVKDIIDSYAQQVQLMGTSGQGQRAKMVNQICIAGILQGLSEALLLAEKAELDVPQVVETLQHGAAGSWQMVNRLETMAQDKFDFGFAIDWMRKDLGICLEEAERMSINMPMTKETDERYARLQEQGLGRMDTSVLVKSFK